MSSHSLGMPQLELEWPHVTINGSSDRGYTHKLPYGCLYSELSELENHHVE